MVENLPRSRKGASDYWHGYKILKGSGGIYFSTLARTVDGINPKQPPGMHETL